MKRDAENTITEWVDKKGRKPLVLLGPRQVGKTWLMKHAGAVHFTSTVYINFERNKALTGIFDADFDPKRILKIIETATGATVFPGKTLIIFDEIQEAPKGITALKYFSEELPELHVIAAGSLLGVGTKARTSFPVGKVELLYIHPLSFREFLTACGQGALAVQLANCQWELTSVFHEQLIEQLRYYYIVGGMPEAVNAYVTANDFDEVRQIQEQMLMAYERDFSKHAPSEVVPRILQVWNGVLPQLAKENKKFVYGLIRSGARATQYEAAIEWLLNYGLFNRVIRTTKIERPLLAFADPKTFKLYLHDVGLLSAMAQIRPEMIVEGDALFKQFKGALTEQYAVQQYLAYGYHQPMYWENPSGQAEVDFIFEGRTGIIPLEVKSSDNLQSKSLKVFHSKNAGLHCFRASLAPFRDEGWMTNVPLYALPVGRDEIHPFG
jgi:predicted AAA+ superfamily ATPase